MALVLSSADLAQLETCLHTLLSPLSYELVGDWRTASREALERLLGADSSASILPMSGEPFINARPELRPAQVAYEQYFHTRDFVLTHRRQELGLEVYHRDMLYRPGEIAHDELYQDWCIPHRLHDTLAMGFQIDRGNFPAGMHFYHEDEASAFGERGVMLLRLLLPAFKAGVVTCVRLAQHRATLERVLDDMEEGLALFSQEGRLLHANPFLCRTMAADVEEKRLSREMTQLARTLGELGRHPGKSRGTLPLSGLREMRTGSARYRLRGTLLGPGLGEPTGAVLLGLERVGDHPASDHDLGQRFGLTRRETQVARLLAAGKSNAEIAEALAVSSHTARRHTEHVRRKLGVRSRSAVGARLRGLAGGA